MPKLPESPKVRSQRSAVRRSPRATAVPNDGEIAKRKKQIVGHIQQTYCGDTSDIEGQAGTDFCTYFVQTYSDKKDTLKAKFRKIEEDIRLALGWTPADCVDRVVEADPDDMPEFWVAPWQIGSPMGTASKG